LDRMYGRMRIFERYPVWMKAFRGHGSWSLLLPVRFALSSFYRLVLYLHSGNTVTETGKGDKGDSAADTGRALIVSVGNLEAGGGGKTPFTIALARAIRERGGTPVAVTRGYRSRAARNGRVPLVIPSSRDIREDVKNDYYTEEKLTGSDTEFDSACEAAGLSSWMGDEALIYRRFGIPLVIDTEKGRGVRTAERLFSPSHVLLDDAFQSRKVQKDVEILLLDAENPFGDGRLLPLGTLRELPGAVERADVVVFTRSRSERIPDGARGAVEGKRIFFARHAPSDVLSRDGAADPVSVLDGMDVALFSGIARPDRFESFVLKLGAVPRVSFRFMDHHAYSRRDIEWMMKNAGGVPAFVTTEKDWSKSECYFPRGVRVMAVRIRTEIDELDALVDLLFLDE